VGKNGVRLTTTQQKAFRFYSLIVEGRGNKDLVTRGIVALTPSCFMEMAHFGRIREGKDDY